MSIERPQANHANTESLEVFPNTRLGYIAAFAGVAIGNLIGDQLFDTGFTPPDAAPRALITVGLIYGIKNAVKRIRT